MLCEKPFTPIGSPIYFGCQKCLPCLKNRRRIWTHRLLLESMLHGDSSFVTLTYEQSKLPSDGNLHKSHYRNWLKRLRSILPPRSLRYFITGEYGPKTYRPHYHAILFGLDRITAGGWDGQSGIVNSTWNSGESGGFTFVGAVSPKSCAYVAGYVTKKLSDRKDPVLNGLTPQFTRMSLRPGIGFGSVGKIAAAIPSGVKLQSVPMSLRHGNEGLLPLGRYLRGKLGISMEITPFSLNESAQKQAIAELQVLRKSYEARSFSSSESGQKIFLDEWKQKLVNIEARHRIFDQKYTL